MFACYQHLHYLHQFHHPFTHHHVYQYVLVTDSSDMLINGFHKIDYKILNIYIVGYVTLTNILLCFKTYQEAGKIHHHHHNKIL